MPSLADLIGRPPATTDIQLLYARVIGAPAGGTATIRFDHRGPSDAGYVAAENVGGVRMLSSASAADGDSVWVIRWGGSLMILGKAASSGASSATDTGVARVGTATFYGDFAGFAHRDRWAAGQYALLQESNGTTYINAYQNPIYIRRDNNNIAKFDQWTDAISFELYGTTGGHLGGTVRHRWWTDGEYQCTSIGVGGDNTENAGIMIHNNWLRIKAEHGIFWQDKSVGLFGHADGTRRYIRNWGDCQTEYRGSGKWWTDSPMVIRSLNADVGYNIHHDGLRNSAVWLGWSDGWFRIEGNGYNAGVYVWDLVEYSTGREKQEMRALERDRSKIKALKPKRFKRKPPATRAQWEEEVAQGIWKDERWNAYVRAQDNEEHVGLVAEEVAQVIPEAVPLTVDGKINGIRHGPILAHLISMVQELDERLDALEGRPK